MKHASIAFACGILAAGPALAQSHESHHVQPAAAMANAAARPMTDGTVQRIDRGAGKITLKHGEIRNLDMPAMTMVFRVADATILDKVKVGQKVKFTAENASGALTVTAIETAN